MGTPPLCGACRSRPCKRKARGAGDGPLYYEWCAVCRDLAHLDVLEQQLDALDAARRGKHRASESE